MTIAIGFQYVAGCRVQLMFMFRSRDFVLNSHGFRSAISVTKMAWVSKLHRPTRQRNTARRLELLPAVNHTSLDNKQGGVTTILQEPLKAAAKGGNMPLAAVDDFAGRYARSRVHGHAQR